MAPGSRAPRLGPFGMAERAGRSSLIEIRDLSKRFPGVLALDREKGAREALKESSGIEVVNTLNTGSDPQKIYAAIENAMLADPSINGLLSLECCSTPPAGTWVQRNNKTGQVKVVGFDLLDQTVELVANGNIEATIDQAPERQGFAAVDMLVKFLKGKTIDNLDTGVGIYTKENIGEVAKK